MVPLAGIEPALLAELDFKSSASTNSATGASPRRRFRARGWAEFCYPGGRHTGIASADQAGIGVRRSLLSNRAPCLDGAPPFP